jgi:hypothetical protein
MRKINKNQQPNDAFCNRRVTVSVLIVSLLPLGEGPGKREVARTAFDTNALSPTLSLRGEGVNERVGNLASFDEF